MLKRIGIFLKLTNPNKILANSEIKIFISIDKISKWFFNFS